MTEESTVDVEVEVEAAETPVVEAEPAQAEDDPYAEVTSLDAVPDETPEPEEEAETAEDAEADAETEETEAEEAEEAEEVELVEFNFGGNKLEVKKGDLPPELESKVQEFADKTWSTFTKGQQDNAEQSKVLAERSAAVEKIVNLNGEALQTYSQGLQLRQEIEQLSSVDLNSMWQSQEPAVRDRARQISDLLASKQADFNAIVNKVGQQEAALDEAGQADLALRSQQGVATLDKRIKDFSTTHAPEVVKYAVENYGMAQEDADQWQLNPTVTEMAYKAMMYDRMQAKAKKPKVTPAKAKPVVPMKAAGKSTAPANDYEKMSMNDYAKARNKQDQRTG
jgi:hypothetical protein